MADWRTRIQQLDGEVIGNCGHHHSGCYPDVGLRSYHDNLALEGGSLDTSTSVRYTIWAILQLRYQLNSSKSILEILEAI